MRVKTDKAEEADLMRELFETVHFDKEPEDLPPHPDGDSEEDDEEPEPVKSAKRAADLASKSI